MFFKKTVGGCFPSPPDAIIINYGELCGGQEPVILPKEFILPEIEERIKKAKTQGRTSSCVAQATAYCQGYQLSKELSARYLFKRAKEIDPNSWGLFSVSGVKTAVNIGICDEEIIPEEKTYSDSAYLDFIPGANAIANGRENKAEIYVRVDGEFGSDYEMVKQFLFREKRPVAPMAIYWYSNYNRNDKSGILPMPTGNYVGHAVSCIGWKVIDGKGYYIILNSFGKNWGDNGKNYLSFNAPTMDAWAVMEDSFKLKEQIADLNKIENRNIEAEKALAMKLKEYIYSSFAKTDRARSTAAQNWILLVNALTYKQYTITDCINWIYAISRGKKSPFDLTKIKK